MVQMKRATPKDREAILKIWGAEFGDGAEFIDPFIAWCGWDHIFLLWEEGKPCAMTAAPLMKLMLADGTTALGGYIYAHTTLKEHRGRGYGRMLLRYADFCMQMEGADCVTLVPAQPSLFDYFRTEFYLPAFFVRERSAEAGTLEADVGSAATPISPEEYGTIRELLLLNRAHAISPDGMLRQQKALSMLAKADLYAMETKTGTACAAVGMEEDGTAFCLEFIAPEGEEESAIAALHKTVGARAYTIRTPIETVGEGRPFGMLKWYDADKAMKWACTKNAWFGLALD